MIHASELWLVPALLALILFADALISVRPPTLIQRCLDGVRLPRDWWWALIVIKLTAAAGLLVGLKEPGVGFAAAAGVIVYFVCAAYAHYRARFFGTELWINCLGMLALSVAAALTYVV